MPLSQSARLFAAAGAVALAATLSSCGFNVATDRVYTPAAGVNDRDARVDVLNAVVVSGQEGSGTLVASFANNNPTDRATVTSIEGAGDDASVTVDGSFPIRIAAGGLVNLATDGDVTVSGTGVNAGEVVTLSMTFGDGQSVEMDVPVVAPCDEFEGLDGSASGSPSSSASTDVCAQESPAAGEES